MFARKDPRALASLAHAAAVNDAATGDNTAPKRKDSAAGALREPCYAQKASAGSGSRAPVIAKRGRSIQRATSAASSSSSAAPASSSPSRVQANRAAAGAAASIIMGGGKKSSPAASSTSMASMVTRLKNSPRPSPQKKRKRPKANRFAKKLAERPSLMERATKSRTSEMIFKLVEKNRNNGDGDNAGIAAAFPDADETGAAGGATNANGAAQTAGRGIKLLLRITEESNELTRKIERQKRLSERQKDQVADLERKVEQARKELHKLQKNSDRSTRRAAPKREGYVVRLDALHMRLNEATTRDAMLRGQINELRLQQLDDLALQRDLVDERQRLKDAQENVLQQLASAQEREETSRLEAKSVAERSAAIVKDLKEEWDALSVFVNAKTEKERERLWTERKRQELEALEEERQRQDDAKKAIMQLSPFGSVLLKHKNQGAGGTESAQHRESKVGERLEGFSSDKSRDSKLQARRKNSLEMKLRQTFAGGLHGKLLHSDSLSDLALAGNLTVNEERALKTNIQQSRWQIARGQVALHTLEGKANSLEQGFELIRTKSGIESPAEMVEVFLQREEEIFRLFTHVNLLSEQIEELESSVEMEREEIERYKGKDGDTSQGRSIVGQLDERLSLLNRRTVHHEEVGAQASKLVDKVKASVASIFVRIGCDTKLIENFVSHSGTHASFVAASRHAGESNGAKPRSRRRFKSPESERAAAEAETISMKQYEITEKNLLQYIGVIEQRVSELLLLYSIATRQKPTETAYYKHQQQLHQQAVQAQLYHLQRLPSVIKGNDDDWSDDDEADSTDGGSVDATRSGGSDIKPLSHQELLRRIKAQEERAMPRGAN